MADEPAPAAAIPAATLILFRPAPDGAAPDILMMRRSADMAFAPGMMVFPGGRVDPADLDQADGDVERAARIAAIRETIEEAGLAVGLDGPADASALRTGLAAGRSLAALIAERGLTLAVDRLVPFARWQPPVREKIRRIFDTRFYLAEVPAGAVASPDGTECMTAVWAPAATLLDQPNMIFPTRRNLERVARFASFEAAAADARAHPIRRISPAIVQRDDGAWLTIPDDLGYPVTAERVDTALRG